MSEELDQLDPTMLEGFCTCLNGKDGLPIRMRDCGLSAHRIEALRVRDREIRS